MEKELVVIGGGGFGRETIDVVRAINAASVAATGHELWRLLGVVDDRLSEVNADRLCRLGVKHLGDMHDLEVGEWRGAYVVGIGGPVTRRLIVERLDARGFRPGTLVHPQATLGSDVVLGEGTVVCSGVRMSTNIVGGRHVHLNSNATVGHDTVIGDFVSANPQATVSGDCRIEAGVLIGAAGVVLNGLTVGEDAIVGASACVVRNVPARVVVKGVPAKS